MRNQSKQEQSAPMADMLVEKLQASRDDSAADDPAAPTATLLSETADTVNGGDELDIEDGLVKESLSELLLLLVGFRTNDAHGKGVMSDLNRFFGTQLSPGTVYPTLHELEEEGLLEVRELVQTKEYFIDDEEAVREQFRDAMRQHLAMGLIFRRAIEDIEGE